MSELRADAWVVRHGETGWNGLGRHTGRAEISVTDRWRRGAEPIAARSFRRSRGRS